MQTDTLENAKKNVERLNLFGPTFGIVNIVGQSIVEESGFGSLTEGFLHIRTRMGVDTDGSSPDVKPADEFMNSSLITQTIALAPSATDAMKRLIQMRYMGTSDEKAMEMIANLPGVKESVKEAIEAAVIKALK